MAQSQKHGFIFENEIRTKVFGLDAAENDTNIHDIPSVFNKYNNNENISIKVTMSGCICCGDILRFMQYDFSKKNTMIVILCDQIGELKIVKTIYEIDYNRHCHNMLFGTLSYHQLKHYVDSVKSIPTNVKGKEAKNIFNYLDEKKELNKLYNFKININPKVDGSQSRVQCSVPIKLLEPYITYKSSSEHPNIVRGAEIVKTIVSSTRERKGVTLSKLRDICKNNKGICRGFTKLAKEELVEFLKAKNLYPEPH
tara:strand:+ start:51 stop:812 length:762 start_codon:yes stop_codon:yes gene_type:complete